MARCSRLLLLVGLMWFGACYDDINIDEHCPPWEAGCDDFDFDGDGVVNAEDPFPDDGRCNAYSDANCTACGVPCEADQTCDGGSCICKNPLMALPGCDTCLADGFVGEACDTCGPNRYPAGSCHLFCEAATTCNGQGTCDDQANCVCDACFDGPTCIAAKTEVCNGLDDNCDGQTDEDLGQTTCGEGVCQHVVDGCVGGVTQSCDAMEGASDEVCNGLDDDCDGQTDEGHDPAPCEAANEWGSCAGVQICQGELGMVCDAVEPAEDVCDGLDNDCDGVTDGGFVDTDTDGSADCVDDDDDGDASVDADDCAPLDPLVHPAATEQCSGVNEDCDGYIDEDFTDAKGDWTLDDHCGGCGIDCAGLFDGGVGACGGPSEAPVCVVESCDPGYVEVDDTGCMPALLMCHPCASDSDCLGGSCVALDGLMGCFVPCDAETQACPDGYMCVDSASETAHCLPPSGSCSCMEVNAGQIRTCVVQNAVGACYGLETCDPFNGWVDCTAPNPAEEICDGIDNDCDGIIDDGSDAVCDDGNACFIDSCDSTVGSCVYEPVTCDDGVDCTVDSCDPVSGCVFTPVDALCDNAMFCDGAETCDVAIGCQPGAPPDLDDGVDCTVDSCDAETDVAVHVAVDALCWDTLYCNGIETCDVALGCQPGAPPYPDDGLDCTLTCDEENDALAHTPGHANCDDDNVCTTDSCDADSGCFFAPVDAACDDAVGCTVDSCDADSGCFFIPDDAACDDGDPCTIDSCDVVLSCIHEAIDCSATNQVCVDGVCVAPIAVFIEGDWNEACSAFDSPGADIDAVELLSCTGDDGAEECVSLGFLVAAMAEAGTDGCTNAYTDPQSVIGEVDYGSEGYVALAGGWVAGEFSPDTPIQSGLVVRVHEFGSVYGGEDDPYEVYVMTDLGCLETADPEDCTTYLGPGFGLTDLLVP